MIEQEAELASQRSLRDAPLRSPRVLMVGPALSVRGGVSAVERVLLQSMPADIRVKHVSTMVDGASWRKLTSFLFALPRLRGELRRADIAHIHFASGASSRRKMIVARMAMRRGVRVIMHAHGGAYPQFWKQMSRMERRYTHETLCRVDSLIVLGEQWRDFFRSLGLPPERIHVAPNPVQLPALPRRRANSEHVRFVYLGLIARRKGTFDLLRAMSLLPRASLQRARLVIAGAGQGAELKSQAAKLGLAANLEVHGWVEPAQRDALLASADAFVLPSYVEGLPMSLLEAMAWGLPPVCTPVGSIPEYIEDGVNGLLAPPGDVDRLAHWLQRLIEDEPLRQTLGRAARRTVEPLAADRYAQRMCALYRSLQQASDSRGAS